MKRESLKVERMVVLPLVGTDERASFTPGELGCVRIGVGPGGAVVVELDCDRVIEFPPAHCAFYSRRRTVASPRLVAPS